MGKLLVETGPDRKKFRVELSEYQGHKTLDLRYWYKDKKSGETKPTKQGLTITAPNYLAFKSVVSRFDEEVISHLNSGQGGATAEAERQKFIQEKAKGMKEVTSFTFKIEALKPKTEFYKVIYEGAEATVVFNESHPFADKFQIKKYSKEELTPVLVLLLSLDLSLMSSSSNDEASGAVALELLKYELQNNLKKYSFL